MRCATTAATLFWFANQRAVEYHPTLMRAGHWISPDVLVLDIDPPAGAASTGRSQTALLVREALADAAWPVPSRPAAPRACTWWFRWQPGRRPRTRPRRPGRWRPGRSGSGPSLATTAFLKEDREGKVFLDATRAGGATVAAAYSPRIRPGTTVSFPVDWPDLTEVAPADFTVKTAPGLLSGRDVWASLLPAPQQLPAELVAEGHEIPVARVAAMHEGKRRARARRDPS